MNIQKEQKGNELYVAIEGDLNTLTSPLLEEELSNALDGITCIVFDFSNLDYISSSGLRVLFGARQALGATGEVIIRNSNETIREIFDITGSASVLIIE